MIGRSLTLIILFLSGLLVSQPGPKQPQQRGLGFRCVTFSPDGTIVAASTGEPDELGELFLCEASTGKRLLIHEEPTGIPSVVFSPDGKTLAIALYDQTAKLLDAGTGKERITLRGHTKEVRAVAFAPDGKTLATGSWDRSVKLWDVATGSEKKTLEGYQDRVYAVAFSPDGQKLVAAGLAREAPIWDVVTGQVIRRLSHGGFAVRTAAFTRDGNWLLTGGYEGTVRIWDARTGEMYCKFQNLGGVDAVAYAPATRNLAVCGVAKTIQLFELSLETPAEKERERIAALLAKLDDDAYAVREEASKELLEIGFIAEPELRRAMQESKSAEVRIRARRLRTELLSRPRASLTGHAERVEDIMFSPDGKLLASASKDGTVRFWDLTMRKEQWRFTSRDR